MRKFVITTVIAIMVLMSVVGVGAQAADVCRAGDWVFNTRADGLFYLNAERTDDQLVGPATAGPFQVIGCDGTSILVQVGPEQQYFMDVAFARAGIPGATLEGLRLLGSPMNVRMPGMTPERMYVGPWDSSDNWVNVPADLTDPVAALSLLLPGQTVFMGDTDDMFVAWVCSQGVLAGEVDNNNATVMLVPPGVTEVTCAMVVNQYEFDMRPGNSVAIHTFNKLERGDIFGVSTDLTRSGQAFNGLFSGTASSNGTVFGCDAVTIWRDGYMPNIVTLTYRVAASEVVQQWGFLTFQNDYDVVNPANTPGSPGGGSCPYLQVAGVVENAVSQFVPVDPFDLPAS